MRITCLDPLRAILAWWVVLIHVLWLSGYAMDGAGSLPVNGFILVSGLVITLLLTEKGEPYGTFIFRRALRLFPVYLVALSAALAVGSGRQVPFFWCQLAAHLSLLHGAIPEIWLPHASAALLTPAWCISLEWQFYLIAPLMVWLVLRYRLLAVLLFIASLAVLWPAVKWRTYGYWSEMGAALPQKFYLFLLGALLARYAPVLASWKMPAWSAPFCWLGQISYSTYLIHLPLLQGLALLIPAGHGLGHSLLLFGLGAPLIVGASALLYRYVEVPFMTIGKRLARAPVANGSAFAHP
jgi:peptidoglycan/LPS O-acetylase OafA/YrhL